MRKKEVPGNTRKSQTQLCCNRKFKDLIKYTNWTVVWIKVASALLSDISHIANATGKGTGYKKNQSIYTAACRALSTMHYATPGKKTIPIEEAFRFALGSESYAKAARAYLLQVTIVQCALIYWASINLFKKRPRKKKYIKKVLFFIMDQKLNCLVKIRIYLKTFFFWDDGVKDTQKFLLTIRNIP